MDHGQWLEQHDRMMADFDQGMANLKASQEKTEASLRRAIRMGVAEARRQRTRNAAFAAEQRERTAKLDEAMAGLATALKAFLDRGSNGKH